MRQAIAILAILLTNLDLQAQAIFPEQNGASLAGVKEFDARFVITVWLNMEQNQSNFQRNTESAFQLGLRRDGVVVDQVAPNYLLCVTNFVFNTEIIFFSIDVKYYTYITDGVHYLNWETSLAGSVGSSNFNSDMIAKECVDLFSEEWLKWNPRR